MKYIIFLIFWYSCTIGQELPYDKNKITSAKEINLSYGPSSDKRGISHNDKIYYVEKNLKTITCYKKSGEVRWKVNIAGVIKCYPCIGKPVIRLISLKNNELFVVYAKHDFAKINVETGVAEYLGSD